MNKCVGLLFLIIVFLFSCSKDRTGPLQADDSLGADKQKTPVISKQPQSINVEVGAAATFTVKASGAGTLSYQWYKAGSDTMHDTLKDTIIDTGSVLLPGQTKASFVINNAQVPDNGLYYVVVSNSYGSTQSRYAQLYVAIPQKTPRITQQPVSTAAVPGGTAQFNVKAEGPAPLSYQWYKSGPDTANDTMNDTVGIPVPGATQATLVLKNVQQSNAGIYYAVVSNPYGSTQSRYVELCVDAAPRIIQEPMSVSVKSGATASFSVKANGVAPLLYQWYKWKTDSINDTTNDTTRVANSIPLPGQTKATLVISNITLDDGGYYYVIVSNSYGSVKSRYAVLSVDISDKIPVITQQPLSQAVKPGATVTFSARATGEAPLIYQWERDSTIMPGQTLPDCTIKNVKQSDLGWYYITVTNSWGTARSDWALLSFVGDSLAPIKK